MKLKKILTSILAVGILTSSMLGCGAASNTSAGSAEDKTLTELTITHVTSPLNVPSILQKNKNIFVDKFSKTTYNDR